MKTATLEATLAAAGQKATVGGASTTGIAWYFSNEFLGVMGILIALAGLMVNFYFRRKEFALKHEEHIRRMELMAKGMVDHE